MIKVGINGFGRIGRFVFRAAQNRDDIQIVGINDLCPVDYLAYMLKYDTMHGAFEGTIEADVENSQLIVNGKKISVFFWAMLGLARQMIQESSHQRMVLRFFQHRLHSGSINSRRKLG